MNDIVKVAVETQPVPAKKAPTQSVLATAKPAPKKVTVKKPAVKKPVVAKPAEAPVAAKAKPKKDKLIRDSFTIPESEYKVLADIKKACLDAAVEVKKSQLIRIAIAQLSNMSVPKLSAALKSLAVVQAGRPKK